MKNAGNDSLLSGLTVLVVDDESVMRDVVGIMFEDAGAKVITASSGEDAVDVQLDSKRGAELGLACLDYSMAGMNGYETCLALRARQEHLPVLFISGLEMTAEVQQLVSSNQAVFLAKPFTEEDLIMRAQEAVAQMR